jgi:hypothetical protein
MLKKDKSREKWISRIGQEKAAFMWERNRPKKQRER